MGGRWVGRSVQGVEEESSGGGGIEWWRRYGGRIERCLKVEVWSGIME